MANFLRTIIAVLLCVSMFAMMGCEEMTQQQEPSSLSPPAWIQGTWVGQAGGQEVVVVFDKNEVRLASPHSSGTIEEIVSKLKEDGRTVVSVIEAYPAAYSYRLTIRVRPTEASQTSHGYDEILTFERVDELTIRFGVETRFLSDVKPSTFGAILHKKRN